MVAIILGACIDVEDINCINPVIREAEQDIFPGHCHLVKLVRISSYLFYQNSLANKTNLINGENNTVSWQYIVKLHQLQESEGVLVVILQINFENYT